MDGFKALLTKNNQHELLKYLAVVDESCKQRLSADFHEMGEQSVFEGLENALRFDELARSGAKEDYVVQCPVPIQPSALKNSKVRGVAAVRARDMAADDKKFFRETGLAAIKGGEVAIVILAGGQGSRLGYDGPKGVFELGLPSKSTPFALMMRRLQVLKQLVGGASIPVYIMTSEQNDSATKTHFEANKYFGLPKNDVTFFVQTVMPSFDKKTHNVLLESESSLSRNPNGNGGVFESLKRSGCLEDIQKRGVKYLHVHGVDNILVKPADPLFIGVSIASGCPVANKCCAKKSPSEKVGVQVAKKYKDREVPSVVEYTEISKEDSEALCDDGKTLKFSAGNIVNHFFKVDFLTSEKFEMPYHIAIKSVPYFDMTTGQRMGKPVEPNAIKLEYFIFDAFELASSLVVLEVENRDEEFAPVKNATGADSPASARELLTQLHTKWLKVKKVVDEDDPNLYEIMPGQTYEDEGVDASTQKVVYKAF